MEESKDNNEKIEEIKNEQSEELKEQNEEKSKTEETDALNDFTKLQTELNDFKDKYLRKIAEFENFKRRKEVEFVEFLKYANENLIKDLLPIIDDLERSLSYIDEEKNNKNLCDGVQLIYNKFLKTLNSYGLTTIEALNNPFDVEFHEALLQVDREGVPPHTVVEEVQKGYKLKDKVIRHSKVIVSSDKEVTNESEKNK